MRETMQRQIRESAPLTERLKKARGMIGKMCSQGRPPHMTIPPQWDDEDFFINETLREAGERIQGLLEQAQETSSRIEELEAEIVRLRGLLGEAAEEIWNWGCYAVPYFQAKHDLPGTVAKFRREATGEGEGE